MRLYRLNLVRYGHFTDFILNFGDRPKTGLDFHIIFGENEAGKSTAFNGYLDLLFGIEKQSKYNFLHSYNNLQLSAIVEINSKKIEVARIKKNKGSLIGANGLPIDEELLIPALYGLSRESYQQMFSLNDETIEKGGEEILASKGDIGRVLFTGASGLTEYSEEIEILRERANKVYAKGTNSYEIATLRQELQQIENERKNLDTHSINYDKLNKRYHTIEKTCQDNRRKKKDLNKEKFNLSAIKEAFIIWNKLTTLEDELEQIGPLPEVPETWIKEVRDLQQERMNAVTRKDYAQADIECSKDELENLKPDPIIIGFKEKIAAIVPLKVRAQTAREYLSKVRDDLLDTDSKLEEIRKRLGVCKDAKLAQFILSDDIIANLSELLRQEPQLLSLLHTAKQEASDAQDALLRLQWEAKQITPLDEKMTMLIVLFDEYVENDPQPLLDQAQDALDQIYRDVEQAIQNLSPWRGNRDNINDYEVPILSQVNRWSTKIDTLKKKLETQKTQRLQQEQILTLQKRNVNTLSIPLDIITDQDARASREKRDKAWTLHKKTFNGETASAFERELAFDDRIRDDLLVATERLTKLRIEEANLAEKIDMLRVINAEIKSIEVELQESHNEIIPVLRKAGLPEKFPIEELSKWVENFQNLNSLIEKENKYLIKRDKEKYAYDRQRSCLLNALKSVGQTVSEQSDLKELRSIAKHYRDEANQNKMQYSIAMNAVSQAEEQIRKRDRNLEVAKKELEDWELLWNTALTGLWLEKKNTSQVRAILESLRGLASLETLKEKHLKEIHTKQEDSAEFHEAMCDLLYLLGEEKSEDLIAQFSMLQRRLAVAQEIEASRNATRRNHERFENQLDKANIDISRCESRFKEMSACFTTCEEILTLDELAVLVEQSKRKRELKTLISEEERNLIQRFAVKTRNEAEEQLKAKNPSEVEVRLSTIDEDLAEVEQELERLIRESVVAKQDLEAIGMDANVARLNEKRESLLLEITNKANRALALHLGLMAADRALLTFRDRHRSELLKQTSEAFKCITSDEFTNLTTELDRSEERLIAMRSRGGSLAVGAMSKGTRFQLYLALRLAGYRRFCSLNGPLPFIGDDIMETFDDGRAESAIRQLCEIAKDGQVLYFTHHRHLCDIAKKVCGNGVVIHEIPKSRALR